MNLDEFAKSLLARFKPVAFYRFDDEEFAKYKQVVFIGQKRASIGLYRKEYEEWMSTNPGAPLENIPYIPKDPDTRMEVPVSLESEIELFTTKEFDEAILLHNTSALVPVGWPWKANCSAEKRSAVSVCDCGRRTGPGRK